MKILLLAAPCAWLLILTGILYLCVQCPESQTLIAFVRRDPHVCSSPARKEQQEKKTKWEKQPSLRCSQKKGIGKEPIGEAGFKGKKENTRQEQKKCAENVPGLNLAIRQKNNFSARRADKAVVGSTTVSLPFLKKLYHNRNRISSEILQKRI